MLSVTNQVVKLIFFIVVMVNTNWAVAVKTTQAQWATTIKLGKAHTTTLQFYFHDTASGKSPTVIPIARPKNPTRYSNNFGTLMMADDPLTVGPNAKSKLVGRAQGLYGFACQDEFGLLMALSYSFLDGPYNGSSISIMGRNSITHPIREMPIVGGTGVFRMGRGYAIAHTYSFDVKAGDAIVGYNVTIVH